MNDMVAANRIRFVMLTALLVSAQSIYADEVRGVEGKPNVDQVEGDNTRQNSHYQKPTAESQSHKKDDVETTRKIRAALTNDSSLSTYAHNIKIVTKDQKVQLRGPVRNEQEKQIIIRRAEEVAGAKNVKTDISVVPDKK